MFQYKSIPFGLGSAPRTFIHFFANTGGGVIEKAGYKIYNLPGRPDFLESEPRFSGERQGFSHMAPPAVGVRHKLGEVKSDGPRVRGLFGIHNKFISNDTGTTAIQSTQYLTGMPEYSGKTICSVRALSRWISKLTASVMAVLQAPLHYRRLQMQKTRALFRGGQNYNTMLKLTPDCLNEIRWWLYYLKD